MILTSVACVGDHVWDVRRPGVLKPELRAPENILVTFTLPTKERLIQNGVEALVFRGPV